MLFVSVPNYSVRRFNKDYYSVALTNGNIGAGLVHKDDFDEFVKAHNGKDYRKTAKKIAVGLTAIGLVTTGILLRKPIIKTAKEAFETIKNSNFVKQASEFTKNGYDRVKTVSKVAYENVLNYTKGIFEKIKGVVNKSATTATKQPFQGVH